MRRLALLTLVAAAACGKQTFLAAAFVETPKMQNPQDPTKPIPPYQVMTAYLGTIDTTNPTKIDSSKVGTIDDATAQVIFHHVPVAGAPASDVEQDRVLKLAAKGSGNYQLTSRDDAQFTFEQTPYTLVLRTADGEDFGARMSPGQAADMAEFQNTQCTAPSVTDRCRNLALGSGMTLTRTDTPAAGASRPPAFVIVLKVDPQNPNAEPVVTYKTVPADAVALLKYVLSDESYRWATADVPSSAFPSAGVYIVTLLTATQGKVSNNAFLGSVAIAAAGAAGVVQVK